MQSSTEQWLRAPPHRSKPGFAGISSRLFPSLSARLRNARELQQWIDLTKYLRQLFGKRWLRGVGRFHLSPHNPALDLLPVLRLDGPALVLCPFPFFRGVPIAVVSPAEPPFLSGNPLGLHHHTRFCNQRQRRFPSLRP